VAGHPLGQVHGGRFARVAWRTVGAMCERVAAEKLDPTRLAGLVDIGVDEISWRRHHKYLTLVSDHDTSKIVWGTGGHTSTSHQSLRLSLPYRFSPLPFPLFAVALLLLRASDIVVARHSQSPFQALRGAFHSRSTEARPCLSGCAAPVREWPYPHRAGRRGGHP